MISLFQLTSLLKQMKTFRTFQYKETIFKNGDLINISTTSTRFPIFYGYYTLKRVLNIFDNSLSLQYATDIVSFNIYLRSRINKLAGPFDGAFFIELNCFYFEGKQLVKCLYKKEFIYIILNKFLNIKKV